MTLSRHAVYRRPIAVLTALSLLAAGVLPAAAAPPNNEEAPSPIAPSERGPEQRVGHLELPPEAEVAINKALAWLATQQNKNGSWGDDRYYVANTALCLMAFLVQGHVPGRGQYGETIRGAVDYLLGQSQAFNGYVVDESSGVMYQHCLATMALCEAWGQSKDPRMGLAVKKAVDVLLRSQNKTKGGWRYAPQPTSGDISVTVMAIEALVSAKEAGILVPDRNLKLARHYIYSVQKQPQGWFTYKGGNDETNTYRMGAGLLSLQLTGDRSSPSYVKALHYLRHEAVAGGWAFEYRSDWLDQFYCVQACYQAGSAYINFWYPRIMGVMVNQQEPSGRIGKSNELPYGSTAVAVLVLGVPYRYLPIFQR